jgi:hypothetical protein
VVVLSQYDDSDYAIAGWAPTGLARETSQTDRAGKSLANGGCRLLGMRRG